MDSDLQQQQQMNPSSSSGLTRYRSAPSSYFSNIIDREFYEHIFSKPSSPETERVFSRFMSSLSGGGGGDDGAAAAAAAAEEEPPLAQKISPCSEVKREIDQNDEQQHVVHHHHQQQQQQQSGEISIN